MNEFTKLILGRCTSHNTSSNFSIEITNDGYEIAKIKIDDKLFFLGSKYKFQRDIDKIMQKIKKEELSVNIIFGLSSGEYVKEILNKIDEKAVLIIIEPNHDIIKSFIERKRYLLDDNRLVIINNDVNLILNVLNCYISDINYKKIMFEVFTNYEKVFEKELNDFLMIFKEFYRSIAIIHSTSVYFSETWFNTYFENLKEMVFSRPINLLKNKFKNIPAIVVSAGPSLEKNIHLLKNNEKNFIIITGGRTLKALKDNGINPDFVCVIDSGEPSYKVIEDSLESNSILIYNERTNYKVTKEYKGLKMFFTGLNSIKKILNYDVDSLYIGGSVAHTCADLGIYLGCNPIIFIGQDFAYTNDKHHADIAKKQNVDNDNIDYFIEVKDISGGKVKTTIILDYYRKNMENLIRNNSHIKFINATEGGADIEGTEVKLLSEVLNIYGKTEIKKDYFEKNEFNFDMKIVLDNLNEYLSVLNELILKLDSGLKVLEKMKKRYKKNIDKYLLKLNSIDEIINKNITQYEFVNFIAYPFIHKIMSDEKYLIKETDDYEIVFDKIYNKNHILYEVLNKLFKDTHEKIKNIIFELEDENELGIS